MFFVILLWFFGVTSVTFFSMIAKYPRAALLIESSRGYGRGLLRGIADYVRVHGPWSIYLQRHHLYDATPAWLKDWRGDGIIARVENRRIARSLRCRRLPVVDLRGRLPDLDMPAILTDDDAGARIAAAHLLERGFRQFAYCGFVGTPYSDERSRVFNQVIEQAGFRCFTYESPTHLRGRHPEKTEIEGGLGEEHVTRWLRKLPRPIGLMACNDARGQQMLNACRDLGIHVPEEMAVVGVDNDDVICDLCDPPLSSVSPNTAKIGYEAAALLDRMMRGEAAPQRPIYIEPVGIVTRRSTDVLAIENADVTAALLFIRDHACDGISVSDVVTHVSLSCSALERQLRKILGRTPKAEIVRVQLDRVKQLLAETVYPLKKIALEAGFKHPEYMCAVFKSKFGQTPGQYRAQARERESG
jgi:LacI family transcriptional regulator